jgi:hypothetical protein
MRGVQGEADHSEDELPYKSDVESGHREQGAPLLPVPARVIFTLMNC